MDRKIGNYSRKENWKKFCGIPCLKSNFKEIKIKINH